MLTCINNLKKKAKIFKWVSKSQKLISRFIVFFYLCEKYFNNFMKFVHRSVIPESSHLREIYQHSSKIYCSSEFNAF